MRPRTRSFYRRLQAAPITRLRARRMDDSFLAKVLRDSPYNTRSSPTKKDQAGKPKPRLSCKWSDRKRALFFELCVEEHTNGKTADGILKPEALNSVATQISRTFDEECTVGQCRNFWNAQKKLWSLANILRNATGLSVDPVSESVVADDSWWVQACQVCSDMYKLKGKNLEELLHYGDILFKNVTATGEHVEYASMAVGANYIAGSFQRIDLNIGLMPDDPQRGEDFTLPTYVSQHASCELTPGSRSTIGSKRKSCDDEESSRRAKKPVVGTHLLGALDNACKAKCEKENQIPPMELCWPHLIELFEIDGYLSTYGATMLGNNERQRSIFLGWPTLGQKLRWLATMEKNGYK